MFPSFFVRRRCKNVSAFIALLWHDFLLIGGLRHIEIEKVPLNHPSANTMMTPEAPAVTTGVTTGTLWLFNIAMENHHF